VVFAEPNASFSGTLRRRTPALVEADRLLALSPHVPRANDVKTDDYRSYSAAPLLEEALKNAMDDNGSCLFSNCTSKTFTVPVGSWPQGQYQHTVAVVPHVL
jgi:hypothetical protein